MPIDLHLDSPQRVAIIGAGLAGLGAARCLQAAGVATVVYEKSRSLGGRCASRLWKGHVVDSGAQYFTAGSTGFSALVEEIGCDLVKPLGASIELPGGDLFPESPHGSRLYHTQGNNRLGKALAAGLEVRLESTVDCITPQGAGWQVLGESYSAVICTAPLPQAAGLTGLPLAFVGFIPCLTAFVELEGEPAELGECATRYGLLDPDPISSEPVAWSACENHKLGRVRPGKTVMVVQASESFSREHLEAEPSAWTGLLANRVAELWELPTKRISDTWGHRWRYARSHDETRQAPPMLPPGLFLAGDSLVKSRVEGAYLDGVRAAGDLLQYLGKASVQQS